MLVTIVAVPLPDNSGLDLDRLEKVEDIHPELALKMLDGGTARIPSSAELAAYRDAQLARDAKPPYDNGGHLPGSLTKLPYEPAAVVQPEVTP